MRDNAMALTPREEEFLDTAWRISHGNPFSALAVGDTMGIDATLADSIAVHLLNHFGFLRENGAFEYAWDPSGRQFILERMNSNPADAVKAPVRQLTVFYAWQSDTDPKCNHRLIAGALEEAIKGLNSELKIEEAVRLDHDIKGETGTPEVAPTIFKKIAHSDLFVADVTFCGRSSPKSLAGKPWPRDKQGRLKPKAPGETWRRKRLPNPNVLLELGFAANAMRWENIFLIMNTSYGTPDALPFDLKHHAHPIQYELPYGASKSEQAIARKQVADAFKVRLKAAAEKHGKSLKEAAAAERQAAVHAMARKHDVFVDDVLRGRFHNCSPPRGVICASIHPSTPADIPLEEPETEEIIRAGLNLICAQGFDRKNEPDSSVILHSVGNAPPLAASELTRSGSILMTDSTLLSPSPPVDANEPTLAFYVVPFEESLISTTVQHLRMLAALGVSGPYWLFVSLHRIQQYFLTGRSAKFVRLGRRFDKEKFPVGDVQPVEIPPALEVSFESVAKLLKPIFSRIWRAFGHSTAHSFKADTWIGGTL